MQYALTKLKQAGARVLLAFGPVLVIATMFNWLRPPAATLHTGDYVFHLLGALGAILVIPFVVYFVNINIWITATMGIWCIGLAAYIFSGIVELTNSHLLVVLILQVLWLLLLALWVRVASSERYGKHKKQIAIEELAKGGIISRKGVLFYRLSRRLAGFLFLLSMALAFWLAISIGHFDLTILTLIWAISFCAFLISLCIAMLPTATLHSILQDKEIDVLQVIGKYFVMGILLCWVISLIVSVFSRAMHVWMISIISIFLWGVYCYLWYRHFNNNLKLTTGVDKGSKEGKCI